MLLNVVDADLSDVKYVTSTGEGVARAVSHQACLNIGHAVCVIRASFAGDEVISVFAALTVLIDA